MAEDLTALSASQLQERTAAVERELQRRAAQDQAQRDGQFRTELDQVRKGERRLDDEHVAWLTPGEVEAALNRGQAAHLGISADRRLSRR